MHEGRHEEILEWYRKLLQLRHGSASLNDGIAGGVKVLFDEVQRWLTMERGQVLVMCNLGAAPVELENPGGLALVLASRDGVEVVEGGVVLPPDSLAVLSGEKLSRIV